MSDNFVKSALEVERAASDMRRGVPVVLCGEGQFLLAMSAERLAQRDIDLLRSLGDKDPALLITQQRAAILKVQHKGAKSVRLALPGWLTPAQIAGLADPSSADFLPLSGPHRAVASPTPLIDDAVLRLARIGHLLPAALVVPLDTHDASTWAAQRGLLLADATNILDHERDQARDLQVVARAPVPLSDAEKAELWAFRASSGGPEHLAIIIGEPDRKSTVLARLHSECFTGDLLASLKCDCGDQLRGAIAEIANQGSGILLYLAQEGRGIGLIAKLKAYALQAQGYDTVDSNLRLGFDIDERIFEPAAQMLKLIGVSSVRLMTNNPEKVAQLEEAGIAVTERVAHKFPSNQHNELYLSTKRDRTGHFL